VLYLILAALGMCTFLALQPPFQTSDAYSQFARAVELVRGQIDPAVITRAGIGVVLPISVIKFFDDFASLRIHPGLAHVAAAAMMNANSLHWSGGSRFVLSSSALLWPNGSGSYSGWLYIPQMIGIEIARALGLSLLAAYYLAAALNGACAISISYIALRVAGFGKALMFGVLVLPMTLSLYFSVSPDALMIAIGALVFALMSSSVVRPPPTVPKYRLTITGLSVLGYFLCVNRPPYLPLFLILLLIRPPLSSTKHEVTPVESRPSGLTSRVLSTRALPGRWWTLVIGGAMVIAAGATFLAALKLGSTGVALPGAAFHRQLEDQLSDPVATVGVFWHTITALGPNWVDTFIGEIGWYGIGPLLGRWVYLLAAAGILALALVGGRVPTAASAPKSPPGASERTVPEWAWLLGTAAVLLIIVLLTMESLYLSWSPVGDPVVAGVQGRYFLPIAFFAAFALWPLARPWRRRLEGPVVVAFSATAVAMMAESAVLLLTYFWVGK
jgi:hypothetical protein